LLLIFELKNQHMYFIYTLALIAFTVLLLPAFVYRNLKHQKYLSSLGQRLGFLSPDIRTGAPTVWVHAVSVGETLAVGPLVKELHQRWPHHRIVFSTITLTGQTIAQEKFSSLAQVIYFPFDFVSCVRRALDAVAPALVLIVETEIWPNFLRECRRRQIPVVLLNGRISDGSFRRYRLVRRWMSLVLSDFRLCLMQDEQGAERLRALGAPDEHLAVTGNLKFDLVEPPDLAIKAAILEELLGFSGARIIVAGSTARGEEELLLKAFSALIEHDSFPSLRLVLVPRHPERFDEVEGILRQSGLPWVRRTQAKGDPTARTSPIVLIDTIGELMAAYAHADIAFVGGSLVPVGGHNILEPALFGKPTVVGPYTSNFQAIVETFLQQGALVQLSGSNQEELIQRLVAAFKSLLDDPPKAHRLGEQARRILLQNRGATQRTLEAIAPLLNDE
jgi:3-deoxy-D-manno-octulosonic-acid transferase